MLYRRARVGNDLLDAECVESSIGDATFVFPKLSPRPFYSDSMTTSTTPQAASMRQPGLTRGVAQWRAPIGAASSAYGVDRGLKAAFSQESDPTPTVGAATWVRGHA